MSLDNILAHTIRMNDKAKDKLLFFPYISELDKLLSPEVDGWDEEILYSLKRGDKFLKTHPVTYYEPKELMIRLTNFFSNTKNYEKRWKGIPNKFKKSFVIFSLSFHMYNSILDLLDKEDIDEETKKELELLSQNILRKDFESIYKWKDKQKELADLLREVTDNSYLLVFNFFDIVESYMGIYPYLDELIELIKLNDSNPSKDEIEDPYIKDIEEALNMHAIKFNEDTPEIDKYQVEIFRDILKSGNYIEIINFYIKNKNVGVFNEIENLEARIKELAIALSLEREINLEQVEEEYRSYVKRNILEPLKTKDFAKILGELKRKEKLVKLLKVDEAYINSFIEIAENYLQYSRSNQNNPLPAEVLEILRKRHKLRSNSKEKNIMISDPYLRDFEETLQIKEENIILEAQKEKILNALANSNFENGYLPLVKLVDTQKGVLNSFPHAQEAYNELEITLVLLSKSNDYVKKIESMLKDKKFGKLYAEFKTIGIDTLSDRLDIDRSEIKKFLNIAERYMDRKSEEKEINVRCDNDRIVFYIGDELQGEKLFIKGSFFDNRDTEVYRLGWTSVDIDYDTNIGYIKMENRLNTSSFSKFKGRVYAE